jgi:glutathione S-transferase
MRARLAIAVSGQIVQLRDKPPAFLATSAKGTVPVLDLLDGTVIEESRDIMMWALGANDPDGWLDIWQKQPDKAKTFLDNVDGPFKHDLDRYKYASRYEASRARQHRENGAQFLTELDQSLGATGALSGYGLGFLDFAILPFIRQFRIADPEWFDAQPWPHLHRWLQKFLGSAAFLRVMLKYPPWQEGVKAIRFPA